MFKQGGNNLPYFQRHLLKYMEGTFKHSGSFILLISKEFVDSSSK